MLSGSQSTAAVWKSCQRSTSPTLRSHPCPRAACRLARSAPVGYAELVEGVIEQLELPDFKDPLAYQHGSYRSVGDLPDQV